VAVLPILTYPDPRLTTVSRPVEQFDSTLRDFVRDLEETMRLGPGAVGIAAPQVGMFQRIVIVDVSAKKNVVHHGKLILVNPEILMRQGAVPGREGCLSVPDYTGNVTRAERIRLRARDLVGALVDFECEGYEARAVQHEIDHLDGLLFLDRLSSRRTDLFPRKKIQD
jgi:peptide deformylase